jgi:hypothetical protein
VSPELPEVIRPRDARGERPENAAGIGGFWYQPEVWTLPLFPDVHVLYAGLCSYLGHREIDRKDLRNTPKGQPEAEIERPRRASPSHDLLVPDAARGYEVRPVGGFG